MSKANEQLRLPIGDDDVLDRPMFVRWAPGPEPYAHGYLEGAGPVCGGAKPDPKAMASAVASDTPVFIRQGWADSLVSRQNQGGPGAMCAACVIALFWGFGHDALHAAQGYRNQQRQAAIESCGGRS